MFPIRTKNRKAISAVLTTIIILVASIVLGTGVVVFSTGLFQTGGQQQSVQVQGIKAWVNGTNSTGTSWGAFAVKNTGDKLVAINSITLRGVAIPYSDWFVDSTNSTQASDNFQAQFVSTGTDKGGFMRSNTTPSANEGCTTNYSGAYGPITINENVAGDVLNQPSSGKDVCLIEQNGPVSLLPGAIAIVYFKSPSGLYGTTDAGVTSTISILAGTAPVAQTVRLANS